MNEYQLAGATSVIGLGLVYCGALLASFRLNKQYTKQLKTAMLQQLLFLTREQMIDVEKVENYFLVKYGQKLNLSGTINGPKAENTGNTSQTSNSK